MERKFSYFVSDVHLGLRNGDPDEREQRFLDFLRKIDREDTEALFLLGDIWDFWYEYRDVVPRTGMKVVSRLVRLMDDGIDVYFCPGNHDIWTYSFFESLGMKKVQQPFRINISGKVFCLGHGDGLGGSKMSYRVLQAIFRCRTIQRIFSTLHPWIAYRFGLGWSRGNRKTHKPYHFKGEEEPLYRFALAESGRSHVDYFVFGHFHDKVDLRLPSGARLCVLKDWMEGGQPHACFNGSSFELQS